MTATIKAKRDQILVSIRTQFSAKLAGVVERNGAVLQSNSVPLDAFMRDLANNIAQGLIEPEPELDDAQRELEAVRSVDYRALLLAKLRTSNLNLWLEHEALKLGTPSQNERYDAGDLSEDDLLDLARGELFRPFNQFTRWTPLKWQMVTHKAGCAGRVELGHATLSDDYPSDTYGRMMEVVAMLAEYHPWCTKSGTTPNIEVRRHVAACPACKEKITNMSALITIPWAGRTLSKEYSL